MTDVLGRAAAALSQVRQSTLFGDLGDAVPSLELQRFTAVERLSEPFNVVADVVSATPVDFEPHLGVAAGVKLDDIDGISRLFSGRLFEARWTAYSGLGHHYELTIRPWLSLLDLNLNSRVFQDKKAIDVVMEVLNGQKVRIHSRSGEDRLRGYCNQYRESDFAFVSRLLEEEGYFYWFEHTEAGEEMVICGRQGAHREIPGAGRAPYRDLKGSEARELSFWHWSERIAPVPATVSLRDTHHLMTGAWGMAHHAVATEVTEGKGPAHTSELYDFPSGGGGVAADGEAAAQNTGLAKLRLQGARARKRLFTGEGNLFALGAGAKFTLAEADIPAWDQHYLIISCTHSATEQSFRSGAGGGEAPTVQVEAIPLDVPFRAPLAAAKPVVAGPTTAMVVGPKGQVIHVDEHGRVKVRFSWDRRKSEPADPDGDKGAVWIRVSQGWAGVGYGLQNIPRVNTEVIVDFVDGDPDLPVVTGRLHAKAAPTPMALPGNKTQSTWRSQTVGESGDYGGAEEPPPKEGGFNEIRLEDKGGSEEVYIHAQRVRSDWTRLDEKRKVGRDQVRRIGRDRATEIKRHETLTVEDGDETRTLKSGSRTTTIQKADTLTLKTGDSTTTVDAGNLSVTVSKGKIAISAMQEIALKVGATTLTMTPTGITLNSTMVNAKAKAMMTVEGAMTTVKASGILTEEGKLVMIN